MRTKKLLGSSLSLLMAVSMVGATSAFAAPSEHDTTSIEVESHWIGSEGESLTVNLLANDEPVDTATLNGAGDWSHVFEDVAITDGENPITYTIEQVQDIEGYHSHISGGVTQGFDIVHLESPDNPGFEGESINVDVSKSWVGTVGEEAHINLLVDGIEAAEITLSATTSADTGWDYIFENLPVVQNANGEPVTYTVSEDNLEGYDTKIFGTQEQGFLVHNIDVTIPEMIIEGSVVVKYVDEDGKEIALPNTFTGEVGQKYGTTGKDIPGYTLIGVQGEDRGTFEAAGTEVVYVYEVKEDTFDEYEGYVEGHIVVKHLNEDGVEIALREIHTGEVGTKYEVQPKEIRGYELSRIESEMWNSAGTYGEGIAIISYIYEVDESIAEEAPVIGSIVTKYVDENNNEIAPRERISGEIGEEYELEEKEIAGYDFVEVIGDVAGQFGEGISFVEYVYAVSDSSEPSEDPVVEDEEEIEQPVEDEEQPVEEEEENETTTPVEPVDEEENTDEPNVDAPVEDDVKPVVNPSEDDSVITTPVDLGDYSDYVNLDDSVDVQALYDKLEFGMTYDEVVDIIGVEGVLATGEKLTVGDEVIDDSTIYTWFKADADGLGAGFINDTLVSKVVIVDGEMTVEYATITESDLEAMLKDDANTDKKDQAVSNTDNGEQNEPKAQDGTPSDEAVEGQALPDTATNTFNILAVGGGLLAAAGVGLFVVNRRRAATDSE